MGLVRNVPCKHFDFTNSIVFKMARQSGIVPLKGTIGNITFYKSQDGYLAREKGSLDAKRIASDPKFQRTRENGAEFSRAGKAGKHLRKALRSLLQNTSDSRMIARLMKEMMAVVHSDELNERGMRNVADGNILLLEGFEFNANGKLGTTLFADFQTTIDRASGELTVDIPSFSPANMIAAPVGATHFKISSAGVAIDFAAEKQEANASFSEELLLDAKPTSPIKLVNKVSAASTAHLFLALGIEFYQEVNGSLYSLKNGAFNALALVKVEAA